MKGYVLLALFIIFVAFGFDSYYLGQNGESKYWEVYIVFGNSATFALSIFAFLGYIEYIRNEDKIDVKFNLTFVDDNKDNKIDTGVSVLRKNCTRAEIQGLLRILAAGKMFNMKSVLKEKKILELVDKIQTGKDKEIVLDIEEDEIVQFVNLPEYDEILKKYDIVPQKKEHVAFNKKTQQQIDNIEKLLEELKSSQSI
jgi:TM2 domain-containing membrane protein YozV